MSRDCPNVQKELHETVSCQPDWAVRLEDNAGNTDLCSLYEDVRG